MNKKNHLHKNDSSHKIDPKFFTYKDSLHQKNPINKSNHVYQNNPEHKKGFYT